MKILSLDIKNHDKLGDLYLDFTIEGKSSNCIVIAGDNGTGKSTILKIIHWMLSFQHNDDYLKGDIKIKFKFSNEDEKNIIFQNILQNILQNNHSFYKENDLRIVKNNDNFYLKYCFEKSPHKFLFYNEGNVDDETRHRWLGQYFRDAIKNNFIASLFIDTDNVYMPLNIDRVTNSKLNNILNIGTSNEQLLIDIHNQDSSNFANSFNNDVKVDQKINYENHENFQKNISIFKNAFNYFFKSNNLEFVKVDNYDILFLKNNKKFLATNLSKGENQIFNMACKILKNSFSFENITIVDEPETGLHPEWQLKLLNYYKMLLKDKQIIISTHSPFIINSLLEEDKLLILKRTNKGIEVEKENIYYSIGEVEEVSKKMNLIIEKGTINIYVAGPTDKIYLDKVIEIWKSEHKILKKLKITYPFGNKDGGNGGDANLFKYHQFLNNIENIDDNLYFLYDWDIEDKIKNKAKLLKNFKIMELKNINKKEVLNKNILKNKYEVTGIENFISITKTELKECSEKILKKKNNQKEEIIKINIDKNKLANIIISSSKVKQKLSLLKDYLVNNFNIV